MRFKKYLTELDLKGAAKKSGLADIHAKQQAEKKAAFDAKYNNGLPVKMNLKVYVNKPKWTGEDPYVYREFTIDNYLSIRHKLDDVTLIDLAHMDLDKSHHDDKASYAIMKTNKHLTGSIPEFLHELPARTRKRPGYGPEDLRREAYTDQVKESLTEMAKRTTPEAFYKMAVTMYGPSVIKSVTMAQVKAVAVKNDVLIPPYVVKQKVGRGLFNLKPEGSDPAILPSPQTVTWGKDDAKYMAQPPAKKEVSEDTLKTIVRDIVYEMKELSRVWMTQDIEVSEFRGKKIASGGVRDWGQWEVPEDEEDDGDYDWKALTKQWVKKLQNLEIAMQKKYTNVDIRFSTEEKNWISIYVSQK